MATEPVAGDSVGPASRGERRDVCSVCLGGGRFRIAYVGVGHP